jgi:hypothetical protein
MMDRLDSMAKWIGEHSAGVKQVVSTNTGEMLQLSVHG